jgi:hypothetical protein
MLCMQIKLCQKCNIYIYIYIYIVSSRSYITCLFVCMYACMYVWAGGWLPVYMYKHSCMHGKSPYMMVMYVCIYDAKRNMVVSMHISHVCCENVYLRANNTWPVRVCMHLCVYVYTNILRMRISCMSHIHTYIHVYIHTCIHTYMYTCIHVYMHTCIHT